MTTPVARRSLLRSLIYPVLRPVYYPARYYYRLWRVRTAGLNVSHPRSISMDSSHDELAERMKAAVSARVHWRHVSLRSEPIRNNVVLYFERHRELYDIDKGEARRWNTLSGLNSWISIASGDTAMSRPAQVRYRRHSLRIIRKSNFGCRI